MSTLDWRSPSSDDRRVQVLDRLEELYAIGVGPGAACTSRTDALTSRSGKRAASIDLPVPGGQR